MCAIANTSDEMHLISHSTEREENTQDIKELLKPDSLEGDIILDGQVKIDGKEKHLLINSNGLQLKACEMKSTKEKPKVFFVPWRDVIYVAKGTSSKHSKMSSFVLHYIQNPFNTILRLTSLKIEDAEGQDEKWVNIIRSQCLKVDGRPHKLFVLVNPIGGAGRGRQIYQKNVAPIFELAQINTTVVETEKPKHALEIGETQDFSLFDGIVVVGGDGLYQELLQGLTIQTQKKAGIEYNSSDAKFVPPNIPIGIIAAGTGNGVSKWINGTGDFETSALNIIRGEHRRGQIFTVHSDNKFLCISAMLFGYGYWSDLIKRAEELRWMKRARYIYVIFVSLFKKKRFFKCELTYCVSDEKTTCLNNSIENVKNDGDTVSGYHKEDWVTYTKSNNNYFGIFSSVCHTKTDGDKLVLSPFATHIQLGVDSGCNQILLIKNLFHVSSDESTTSSPSANLEFIPNVTAFRIKLLRDDETEDTLTSAQARIRELERILNIDGEVVYVDKPDMYFRLHVSFVSLYCHAKVK